MASLWPRYAELLRVRGTARFIALGFLARMPIGTLGLSTLLYLRDLTGSIAFAGSAVGAQLVASAATAPIIGRLIDTRGPRGVLVACGLLCPLTVLVTLFADALHLSRAAIVIAAAATGAFAPPTVVVVRSLWRYRLPDEDRRRTAFALDSVLLEVAYTVGPALVALAVATAGARVALMLAWVFVALAVPLLFASGGLAWWQRHPPGERHLLGPLREPRLLAIYATTFLLSILFGALEVGYPGFAAGLGVTAWGPALIAINSIGSAAGGIAYGGLHLAMPVERQLPRLLALLALPVAVHAALSSAWGMVPWALVAGLMIAPSMTAVTLLISASAPSRYATEAFTWSSTAIVTGIGIGMAAGGMLVERVGSWAPFALAAASAVAAAAVALRLSPAVAAPAAAAPLPPAPLDSASVEPRAARRNAARARDQ